MKVRAIWEFEADVSDLDPKYVDIPGLAKDLTQRELDDMLSKSGIAAVDFEYEVVSEPLILEEEDYPGEQFELLRKVFGVPGATEIRINNYDISAFVPSTTEKKPETCRERLMREHPSAIKPNGRCKLCPYAYGYLPEDTPCIYKANGYVDCNACWDRPVEEVNR